MSPERGSFFAGIPADAAEELFTDVLCRAGVRVERIVSCGHASPPGFWYDQEWHEWVLVLRGRARVEIAGEIDGQPEVVELGPGDYLDLPAHVKHRVAWTAPDEPTVWLAIHYGPSGTTPP